MITIIGLGAEAGDVSSRAIEAMRSADSVLLRNGSPASEESLRRAGVSFETLDFVYEKSRNFDTLAKNLAAEVRRRAEGIDLCYCVEGSVTEDRAAALLRAREKVGVIEGVPKSAAAAARAGLCGSYTALSAYDVKERGLTLPLVVYDVADREIASDVKLILAERFGDETPACYLCGEEARKIPLYEADRQSNYGSGCALVLYDIPLLEKKRFGLEDLLAILRLLRAPDGCPWDRVQTHESIRINLIEEAYELVDAIDCKDPDKMREEAGDVLMQAAFHTMIEEEKGNFTMTDVLSELCEKLITRHTHVFGKDKAQGEAGALSVWEKNKMTEKHQTTFSDAVNDVPQVFPALLRAQKVAKRMSKGGFGPRTFREAEAEFEQKCAALSAQAETGEKERIAAALGEALFGFVQMGRLSGGDCEQALLDEVGRAAKVYNVFEKLVLSDGKDVNALTREERENYIGRARRADA